MVPETLSTTRCWQCVRVRIATMSLTALPHDCLLACLSRVPYADLRNGLPSTCKSIRDAVASPAFRKTREAAGYVEWAVFARDHTPSNSYLIQASAAYRTVPGPPDPQGTIMVGLSSRRGNEVVIIQDFPVSRADAYHPLQNRWRELAPLNSISQYAACSALGSTLIVIGGYGAMPMPMDVYDSSQDAWSRRPDLPFEGEHGGCSRAIEVDGKLWLYAVDDHLQETFVYDPATQAWTAGPRLPHQLYGEDGVHWHCMAFELRKRFCLMGCFQLAPEDVRYLAFIWDPIRGAWDEAPFPVPPVVCLRGDSIDNNLIVHGYIDSSDPTGPMIAPRLFVLRPGSSDWDEWRIPDQVRAMQVAAVRLG